MPKEWVSISEATTLLPMMTRKTIWRLVHSGRLEATRIGGRHFIDRAAIDKLINNSGDDLSVWPELCEAILAKAAKGNNNEQNRDS